jgi:formate hydrogenlyase transcriptional activator
MEMFPAAAPHKPSKTLEEVEREYIIAVHEATGGRIEGPDGAAKVLGLHPSTLRTRMKKLGIQDSRPRPHARSEPIAVI